MGSIGCNWGDESGFGFVDLEGAIRAGAVGLGGEFGLERDQFGFEVVVEVEGAALEAFATLGVVGGTEEVVEADDRVVEIAVAFHGRKLEKSDCGEQMP